MTVLGAVFLPGFAPERLYDVVRAADAAGMDELWLWEDCFSESGIASAAAALAWTERVRVGIGLLPVPLRNVALTAMEIATLERMFPGRLHVGVGHGVQEWMAQVGAAVESPMTLLREYVTVLRSLLNGDEVTTAGRYVRLERVKLDWPPTEPIALLAGAVRPRSLRLVGEISDGAILVAATSPGDVRQARAVMEEGRVAAGRSEPVPVTVYLLAATGPGAQNRVNAVRAALPDTSSRFAAVGAADLVASAVRELAEAGADRVVLQSTADEPDLEGFVRFVAHDVRALVP